MSLTGKAGGIDAIRYWREALVPKLIPFAKSCRPDFVVQEEKPLLMLLIFSRLLFIMCMIFSSFLNVAIH
jgi:hypothetical protein